MSNARDKRRPGVFIVNADPYRPTAWKQLLAKGLFCTGGPVTYGYKLERLVHGSRLFLYVNKVGVVAEGTVTDEWNRKANTPRLLKHDDDDTDPEYSITVQWIKKVMNTAKAVSPAGLRKCGQRFFAATVVPILDHDIAEAISAQLAANTLNTAKQEATR